MPDLAAAKQNPAVAKMGKELGQELRKIHESPDPGGRSSGSMKDPRFAKALDLWYNWLQDNAWLSKWDTGEIHSSIAQDIIDAQLMKDKQTGEETIKPGAFRDLADVALVFFKIAPGLSAKNRDIFMLRTLPEIERKVAEGEKTEEEGFIELTKWVKNILLKNKGLSSQKKGVMSYEIPEIMPQQPEKGPGDVGYKRYRGQKRSGIRHTNTGEVEAISSAGVRFPFAKKAEAEKFYLQHGGKPPKLTGGYIRVTTPEGGMENFSFSDDEDPAEVIQRAKSFAARVGGKAKVIGNPEWVVKEADMSNLPANGLKIFNSQEEAVASLIGEEVAPSQRQIIDKSHRKGVWLGLVEGYQHIPEKDDPSAKTPKSGYGDIESDIPPAMENLDRATNEQIDEIAESIDCPPGEGVQAKSVASDGFPQEETETCEVSPDLDGGVESNKGGSHSGLKSGDNSDSKMDAEGGDSAQSPTVKKGDGKSGQGTVKEEKDEKEEMCEDEEEVEECGVSPIGS